MGKNIRGGKKSKKKKNQIVHTSEIREKEDGQEYAQIIKCCGNSRFDVLCFDGKERKATLCGTMRKRKFVNANQLVLVSLRDFEDAKCDIIDSYDDNQFRKLKADGNVPDSIKIEEEFEQDDGMMPFDITDEPEDFRESISDYRDLEPHETIVSQDEGKDIDIDDI